MQVAINPSIYGSAQIYAERQGLDLKAVIEDFLVQFVQSAPTVEEEHKSKSVTITPLVARLKTGHSWNVPEDEKDFEDSTIPIQTASDFLSSLQ